MECDTGPSPDGPGMYGCIKLCRDLCRDPKRRSPFRPVRTQALRLTLRGRRSGGPVSLRAGYVSIYQIVPRPLSRSETSAAIPACQETGPPDLGLACGRATIPGRRNGLPVDERNAAVRNDRPPVFRPQTCRGGELLTYCKECFYRLSPQPPLT